MITAVGIVVILVGLIVWIGQLLSFVTPEIATKIGLNSPEKEMDQSLYIIETKANGLSDILLTWTLPLSGFLMIIDHKSWPFLALIGGGIYIYFAFLTIFSRYFLKNRGKKIGSPSDVKVAYIFSVIWIICSLLMIGLAIQELGY
ncbi:MAG: hypothetical protein JAZ06_00850 [Candidatus Thiodiazotropha taylori]|nr:hypothetical protein [Candidatus Thiodiazotropha taylori]